MAAVANAQFAVQAGLIHLKVQLYGQIQQGIVVSAVQEPFYGFQLRQDFR